MRRSSRSSTPPCPRSGSSHPARSTEADAIGQIDVERPHVLVAFGPFERVVGLARERFPGMRIVTDRDAPGATEVAASLEEVRGLIKSSPRPGGPVG